MIHTICLPFLSLVILTNLSHCTTKSCIIYVRDHCLIIYLQLFPTFIHPKRRRVSYYFTIITIRKLRQDLVIHYAVLTITKSIYYKCTNSLFLLLFSLYTHNKRQTSSIASFWMTICSKTKY